tara:strand:- start:784 stop:1515 length:732 start_codon:yes stop_codon:yes gene_type:complete
MNKKILRIHDEKMYLKENRYKNPKQIHLEIVKIIKSHKFYKDKNMTISDYGCAAGELEYTLVNEFPNCKIIGYEFVKALIEKAKQNVKNVEFIMGDINDSTTSKNSSNDISICTGVLPIFDSFEASINNLIKWTKPNGMIIIHSLFNNYDLDVFIKYNHSSDYNKDFVESGWNIFSKKSISNFLKKRSDIKEFSFEDFNLNLELSKQKDLLRSWTFKDQDGNINVTNGLCFIQPHSFLKIIKN